MQRSSIALSSLAAISVLFAGLTNPRAEVSGSKGLVIAKQKPGARSQAPRIDVVFVLDTTGSMAGLINAAKQKIWSIANNIASGEPRPDVRFGLVGYRDRGDAYVTKVTQLTRDIDEVYEELMSFSADGGGDWPEDVNAALSAAISPQMEWSRSGKVVRLVFLVGDAPPHDDRSGVKSFELAAKARRQGILINAVRAGGARDTGAAFQKIAEFGGGEFLTIEQGGGAVAIASPFDAELARLNGELADTMIGYGDTTVQHKVQSKIAGRKGMRAEVAAAAASYSEKAGHMGAGDLISDLDEGRVGYGSIESKKLPPELRKLNKQEQLARIKSAQQKRKSLRAQIATVSKNRDKWIEDKEKEIGTSEQQSFDLNVKSAVRRQAAPAGVHFK